MHFCLFIAIILSLLERVQSQCRNTKEIILNTYESLNVNGGMLAIDGGFVMAYTDSDSSFTKYIFMEYYYSNITRKFPVVNVSNYSSDGYFYAMTPKMILLPTNNILIVYLLKNFTMLYKILDQNGNILTPNARVLNTRPNNHHIFNIIKLSNNNLAMIHRNSTSIYVEIFKIDGLNLTLFNQKDFNYTGITYNSYQCDNIAQKLTGEIVVTFEYQTANSLASIKLTIDGDLIPGETKIITTTPAFSNAPMALFKDGHEAYFFGDPTPNKNGTVVIYDPSGIRTEINVSCTKKDNIDINLFKLNEEVFVIFWDYEAKSEKFLKMYYKNGTVAWPEYKYHILPTKYQPIQLALLENAEFAIVFLNDTGKVKYGLKFGILNKGYTYNGTSDGCISCPRGCYSCSNTTLDCTECAPGYYLSNKTCLACKSECALCDNGLDCIRCKMPKLTYNRNCFCPLMGYQFDIISIGSDCANNCTFPFYSTTDDYGTYCNFPCNNTYLLYNQCNETCNFPYLVRDSRYCYFPCNSSEYYRYDGTCVSNCSYPLTKRNNSVGDWFCDLTCKSGYLINNVCNQTCDLPYQIQTHMYCTFPCQNSMYRYDNNCVTSCPWPLVQRVDMNHNSFCDLACTSGFLLHNTCDATCMLPYLQGEHRYCYFPCPGQIFRFDNSCVDACSWPLVKRTNKFLDQFCDFRSFFFNITQDSSDPTVLWIKSNISLEDLQKPYEQYFTFNFTDLEEVIYHFTIQLNQTDLLHIKFNFSDYLMDQDLYINFTISSLDFLGISSSQNLFGIFFKSTKIIDEAIKTHISILSSVGSAITTTAITAAPAMLFINPTVIWFLISIVQNYYYLLIFNVKFPINLNNIFKVFSIAKLEFLPSLPNMMRKINIEVMTSETYRAPANFKMVDVDVLFLLSGATGYSLLIFYILFYWATKYSVKFLRVIPKPLMLGMNFVLKTSLLKALYILWDMIYLNMTIFSALQMQYLSYVDFGHFFSSSFGMVTVIGNLLVPLYLIKNISKSKWRFAFRGIKEKRKLYIPLNMLKRWIFGVCLVVSYYNPLALICIACILFISSATGLYYFKPYEKRYENIFNCISESIFALVIILIGFIYALDTNSDIDLTKIRYGWAIIYLGFANMGVVIIFSFLEMGNRINYIKNILTKKNGKAQFNRKRRIIRSTKKSWIVAQ